VNKEDKPEKALSPELEPVRSLYDLMIERGLDAVELKEEDVRVKLTRRTPGPSAGAHASPQAPLRRSTDGEAPSPEPPSLPSAQMIATPLAGVFYRASSPTSAPFVKDGDTVEAGQTLCIVEAMKVMNEIKAESRCRILKIVVENGRPVTAGQTLFHIEPA
jgi:acetyl-CoA carboxylase biotin carboxyl carrier protein